MMIFKASLTIVSILACGMLVIASENSRLTNSNRRRAAEDADRLAQPSEISNFQPYESLEVLQSKYGAILDPMSTAASHHHKKGSKGWLDMGAWTKKKGAFGWYADYPVGKGR